MTYSYRPLNFNRVLFFSKEHTQKSDEKYLSLLFPGFFILDFKCELSLYNSKCKFGLTSPSFLYWKVLCSGVSPYLCEHSYSLMLGLPPYVLFPESTVTHGFDFHFHVDGPPPSKTIYTAEFPKIDFSLFAKWQNEQLLTTSGGTKQPSFSFSLWLRSLFESYENFFSFIPNL